MTEQSDKPSVDGLMNLVSEFGQMRWSEGSTGATYLDRAGERRAREEAADTYVEIRAYAERLAALAGPLEQPQEPKSDQANLAQASGGEDLQTALYAAAPRMRDLLQEALMPDLSKPLRDYEEWSTEVRNLLEDDLG